jgi:hypothetical protein
MESECEGAARRLERKAVVSDVQVRNRDGQELPMPRHECRLAFSRNAEDATSATVTGGC